MFAKVTIIATIFLLIYLSCGSGKERRLSVSLTVDEWNKVYKVIDTSAASNLLVKEVKKMIFEQLNNQLDTTIKR